MTFLFQLKIIKEKMELMPQNHRAKWTDKEFKQLLKETKNQMDINEIANIHMRTVGAIKFKLIRYAIQLSEEDPDLSLKNLSKITNLSIEDLTNGFQKLHYDFDDIPDEIPDDIPDDVYMTKLENIEYKINLLGVVISTYFISVLLVEAYINYKKL